MPRIFPVTGGKDGTVYRRIRNWNFTYVGRRERFKRVWPANELHIKEKENRSSYERNHK